MVEAALRTANRKLTLLSSITRHDILNHISVLGGYIGTDPDGQPTRGPRATTWTGWRARQRVSRRAYRSRRSMSSSVPWGLAGRTWNRWSKAIKCGLETKGVGLSAVDLKGIEVFADKMLKRVFMNLIDNSLRHGDGVKAIRSGTRKTGKSSASSTRTMVTGYSQDMREKLFRRGQVGTPGFGLFLSKEILDLTRISISEIGEPGGGALFLIKVPKGIYRYSK